MADLGAPQSGPHPRCRSISAKRSPTENSTPASHVRAYAALPIPYLPCTSCVGTAAEKLGCCWVPRSALRVAR